VFEEDTIVAPATAIGDGGVNILRLSGPSALPLLKKAFRPSARLKDEFASHHLYHGQIIGPHGDVRDEVMAVFMQAPRSYTREDVAEIHCHGGVLVTRRILDQLIDQGARLARPGEFTLRAFLNGRIDLAQAEGVVDVIRAQSERACQLAVGQMEGRLSSLVSEFRDQLLDALALLESWIDFPEEDIERTDIERIASGIAEVRDEIAAAVATFEQGRIIRDGARVLILGKPNVGKSSLLNALLGQSRAIVTELPGTTRDTIEEGIFLEGLRLRLIDTAGVRVTEDEIEKEGVKRATEKIAEADLILLVLDVSRPLNEEDFVALDLCPAEKILVIGNKQDLGKSALPSPFSDFSSITVSVHKNQGLEDLKNAIVAFFRRGERSEAAEDVVIADRRHRDALLRTSRQLESALSGLGSEVPPELIAVDLQGALSALGEITGETTPEEVLNRIFARFCIGK